MFGKRPPPKDSLAERVRDLAARPKTTSAPIESASRKKSERAERAATFKNGAVTFESGERFAVVVKDVSDTGARIEFFTRTTLPSEFILTEQSLRLKRRARVVWHSAGSAGVQFLD